MSLSYASDTTPPLPPALRAILDAAEAPLREAFGLDAVRFTVTGPTAGLPWVPWIARLQLPASYTGDAEVALGLFDAAWWVAHCAEANGELVIDYEHAQEE